MHRGDPLFPGQGADVQISTTEKESQDTSVRSVKRFVGQNFKDHTEETVQLRRGGPWPRAGLFLGIGCPCDGHQERALVSAGLSLGEHVKCNTFTPAAEVRCPLHGDFPKPGLAGGDTV